jgi:hypothetical protein
MSVVNQSDPRNRWVKNHEELTILVRYDIIETEYAHVCITDKDFRFF